jgi:hypothetical protein
LQFAFDFSDISCLYFDEAMFPLDAKNKNCFDEQIADNFFLLVKFAYLLGCIKGTKCLE